MPDPRRFQFPLLSDLIAEIADAVDQPLDEPGQLTWTNPSEFRRTTNQAYEWCNREASSLDLNLNIVEADLAVAAGDEYTLLPEDLRALRKVWRIDAASNRTNPITVGSWDRVDIYRHDAIFIPRKPDPDPDLDGRTALRWTKDVSRAMTVHLVYEASVIPLAHGCVMDYGVNLGDSLVVLGEHEPADTGIYQGLRLWFPKGAGEGQNGVAATYDGPTRTATIDPALAVALDDTTVYTSRPALHRDMRDAYFFDVCARLVEKLDEKRMQNFKAERQRCMQQMHDALARNDRQSPILTRDDSGTSYADPYYAGWPYA